MRVLALTAAKKVTRGRIRTVIEQLDLGPSLELEVLTVQPPPRSLPVARVDVVDPSVIPFRPVIPVSGPGLREWGGPRKQIVRVLRAGRRVLAKVPLPASLRRKNRRYLEIACATSPELKHRAQAADVIVALEGTAARAAWNLAQRCDHPVVVWRAANVRQVLQRHERLDDAGASSVGVAAESPVNVSVTQFELPDEPARLLIAPANYAGQGYAWAESVRRHVPHAAAMSMRSGLLKNPFPVDLVVDRETFRGDLAWRLAWRERVFNEFTHVIVEANRPLLGSIVGEGDQHVTELVRAGKKVAYLSHGSDARIPSVHAARERWHSYDALPPSELQELERRAQRNVEMYNSFEGTVFVSTPGLLEFVPRAVWLPVVVEVDDWVADEAPLVREKPVVAHIPSSAQKGSHLIDPILSKLHDAGRIDYLRVEGVPHADMPALYKSADIMVEQFGIADYSVAACEAMAAGRVVVSRVADGVRETVRRETGQELPIVEANPETLEHVVLGLIADREAARRTAERGTAFVRSVHDGRRSAEVLAGWLARAENQLANR